MNFYEEVTVVTREVVILKWMRSHECEKREERKKPPFNVNGGCRFGYHSINRIGECLLKQSPRCDLDLLEFAYLDYLNSQKLRMKQLIDQLRILILY